MVKFKFKDVFKISGDFGERYLGLNRWDYWICILNYGLVVLFVEI